MRVLWIVPLLFAASALAQDVPTVTPQELMKGAFNSVPPICTSGHGCILQTDANGNLKVVGGTTGPSGITPTDRTIISASGTSQQIMPANAGRHSLTIVNDGNTNCGVNPTGGTAVINGAGTFTLSPLGSYSPRVPTVSAVTIICTAGTQIYADEN